MSRALLRRALGVLLAAVVSALLSPDGARADERAAIEATLEGDKALAAKDAAGAEARFRAALEEDAGHLPAHQGLGEALLLQGRTAEARAAFRAADRGAAEQDILDPQWRRRVDAARKRLSEIDPEGKALAALFRTHADAMAALGTRQKAADPDLSDRAAGVALALVPGHEAATALRAQLATQGMRREALFDGKQIESWDGGKSDWWRVEEGTIVADAKGVATYIRTETLIEGNFDVLVEARLLEAYGASPFIAMMAAWTAEFSHSRFGVLSEAIQWAEHRGEGDVLRVFRSPVADLQKPLDPKTWNLYELRYRDGRMEAWINGRKLADAKRPADRAGGYVGLLAQDCRMQVKRVEVVRR